MTIFRNLPWLVLFLLGITAFPAWAEEMQYPLSLDVAEAGEIFVADRNLPGVWKVTEGKPEVFFQGSKKFRTPLNAVRCVALDRQGRVLAGDSSTREVYRFDESGKPQPLSNGGIGIAMDIGVLSSGELLVSDLEIHRIVRLPSDGGKPTVFAEVPAPRGLFVDAEDRLWIVSGAPQDQLLRATPDGKLETIVKGRPFSFPHTVVVDSAGAAYVCDGYAKTIWKVAPGAEPVKWASGAPLQNPVGLAIHQDVLYVADPHAKAIFQIGADAAIKQVAPPADSEK